MSGDLQAAGASVNPEAASTDSGASSSETTEPSRGPLRRALRQFTGDKVAMAALLWIMLVGIVAVVSYIWTPHDPKEHFVGDQFGGFDSNTWFGADDLGRDVFSRLMVGAAVSMRVSLIVVGVALALSAPIGLLAGYRGGWTDTFIMRILDAVTSVPGIVAALALVGVLGNGLNNVMIALIVIISPNFIRLIRAQALSVSSEPYIAASKSVGSSTPWIMLRRIFPGVIPALSVTISLALGAALTAEAALSFLGIGVDPSEATWGNMLSRANANILRNPNGLFPPLIAIGIVVLAFNLIGDGLRDSLGTGIQRGSRRRAKLGMTTVAETATVAPSTAESATGTQARLVVRDLCVEFQTTGGTLKALDHVNLEVGAGEVLGIVGESGSGKTVTAMSIMRLLQSPPGLITSGSVTYEGTDLLGLSMDEMREVRGAEIAMVFQNPMTSLDPVYTIGNSLREALRNHRSMSKSAANRRAVELLDLVGIPSAEKRLNEYPHNFSGGMRQRAMIAMALAGDPRLLIADEPTTALDVTIQAQILDLLNSLREELGMSMILVTHDLGVVAEICDRVSVMYAGHVVETAPIDELFASPKHPYTAGLLAAVPSTASTDRRLPSLPGSVPQLAAMPSGCRFAPRCTYATDECRAAVPEPTVVYGHTVRCIRAHELELRAK
jgi:peptide/nickel transport system ATP-binding protein/peptide/nickel transport system permease protein